MRKGGARVGRAFRSSVINQQRCVTPHLQQVSYLLPLTPGASCGVEDAQRLFVRCCRLYGEDKGQRSGDNNADMRPSFEESIASLRRLGLVSPLLHNEHAAVNGAEANTIQRAPFVTVQLHSIDVNSSPGGGKEDAVALFQLLHGVIIPLLYSRIEAIATSSSRTDSRHTEKVEVNACLDLLQPRPRGSGTSDTACRFLTELVNEALIAGVRERVLHPCGNGLFQLHRDVLQRTSPCLLALQWWWWRRVVPSVHRAMDTGTRAEALPLEAWIDVLQARVKLLFDKRDESMPRFLAKGPLDAAMTLVTDAARCWGLYPLPEDRPSSGAAAAAGTTTTTLPKWQLQLSDEARVALALETLGSMRACLARRPAGVVISELSTLVSWPLLSSFLRKRSLLKALSHFPFHFTVSSVQGVLVAHQQLNVALKGSITAEEASAWLLSNRNEPNAAAPGVFLQEVDVVIRAVTFLRKRHLRGISVMFDELRGVLLSSAGGNGSSSNSGGNEVLGVLRRYDVIAGLDTEEIISWAAVQRDTVQLSLRETRALRALEAFRKKTLVSHELYAEAIEPFLHRCSNEARAIDGDVLPITLLERWLQSERCLLKRADLLKVLRQFNKGFPLDEEELCIHLKGGSETLAPLISCSAPPPPVSPSQLAPTSVPRARYNYGLAFDSQLSRVLDAQQPDALHHFAQTTVYAVFELLMPVVSVPSGVRMQTLIRRVRWNCVAATLGTLSSFVEAFDGLFFDVFEENLGDTEECVVTAYRGPVGAWMLYARLIARLFPPDEDMPLRLVAESLSWNLRFAPRFGDLPALLRCVGRCCRDGYVLATERTIADTSTAAMYDDSVLWGLLDSVREHQQQESEGAAQLPTHVLLKPMELRQYVMGVLGADTDSSDGMSLAETAVRRLPLFFQWHTAPSGPAALVRVVLPHAAATTGLVAFIEGYVCPLLRQHHGVSVEELDERLGWSCGCFDHHPAGVRVVKGVVSAASLFGVLWRYAEAVQQTRILLRPSALPPDHPVMVCPNTAVYRSPEDMLLEVNGLESVANSDVLLRPSGRPISLFEVLAQERELCGDISDTSRCTGSEEWHVSLQCGGSGPDEWEKELAEGRGDILVWCEA
ncbi:hypothetical protein DQ04_00391030 [Trypanosoma grayi]|uniref:hypothetical protein n=1 Tax=Trypanosoma grayi TaxID=71804 RepID=UPI0004F496DB|nr:hypothetical protein DQ04_00391030 [Trypanosoma grayi]KEG14581.1 hypothetical protein DQ04_00391030 [Trypanosoma grayi]